MLRAGVGPAAVARAHGLAPTSVFRHAINGFAADLPEPAVAALQNNPNVVSITPVRAVQAHAGQEFPTGILRIGADQLTHPGPVDVDVAIVDTGVQEGHPDLNVVHRVDCSDLDAGGCVEGEGDDGYGHGTHVAGTVAALDNESDVIGVAPGARVYSVKVLDDNGQGTTETVVRGLDWVYAQGNTIEVVNMSLGGACVLGRRRLVACDDLPCGVTQDPEHVAICRLTGNPTAEPPENPTDAHVTVVVSAGNSAADAKYFSPAAYNEVITVSALADFDGKPGGLATGSFAFSSCTEAEDDSFACFSNFGDDVDLIAPGVGILSTTPFGLQSWSGTSMAAPHVTGAAALYLTQHPGTLPAEVRQALIDDADPEPCVLTKTSGACDDDGDEVGEPLVRAPAPACSTAADCDDGDLCTIDTCTAGVCTSAPACDDGDACSIDSCDPTSGACSYADKDCDDGNVCTTDSCDPETGACQNVPLDCDDGDACTMDSCDPTTGECAYTARSCDDGNVCTTDSCDSELGCVTSNNSEPCDDGDDCTAGDQCAGGVCVPGEYICTCGANKAPCTVNADCCSNVCKKGTCRGN